MNTEFNIKNFRAFNEEGVTFNIAPITILTGCNSAGKSSMVKSLLLLDNFFNQMRRDMRLNGDCNPANYRLGITNHALRLGNFSSVLNRDSNDNTISFSYCIKPLIASTPFVVTYKFTADEVDALNDGWLDAIEISTTARESVCKLKVNNGRLSISQCDWALLKDSFAQFGIYSILRELNNQISINEILPEASKYSDDDIKRFQKIIDEITGSKWTKRISSVENIRNFNDAYINHDETKTIFPNVIDLDMIRRFIEGGDVLHYLPILDYVKNVSKSDVRNKLQQNTKAWNADMDAIISLFEISNFDSLTDFVRDVEEKQGLSAVGFDFGGNSWGTGLKQVLANALTYRYNFAYDLLEFNSGESIAEGSDGSLTFIKHTLSQEEIELKKQKRREEMSFEFLVVSLWKYSMEIDETFKKRYCSEKVMGEFLNGCLHPIVSVFARYVQHLLLQLIISSVPFEKFIYVGSSKAEAQRLYKVDASNTDSFETIINNYLEGKRNYQGDYALDTFLNRWIQKFDIGHSITIKNTSDGLGIVVYLHKSESDTIGHPLADEGYGITQLLSILLNIETAILVAKKQKQIPCDRKIHGLALVHEDFPLQNQAQCIAVEEPEIHLHPKYQSLLMDMFNDAYQTYNIHFIIETHSEYLVRRSQVFVAEAKYKDKTELAEKCPYRVYYVPRVQDGKPYDMEYRTDGKFRQDFGEGFFDEADKLAFKIM